MKLKVNFQKSRRFYNTTSQDTPHPKNTKEAINGFIEYGSKYQTIIAICGSIFASVLFVYRYGFREWLKEDLRAMEQSIGRQLESLERREELRCATNLEKVELRLNQKYEFLEKVIDTKVEKMENQRNVKIEQLDRVIDTKLAQNQQRIDQLEQVLNAKRDHLAGNIHLQIGQLKKLIDMTKDSSETLRQDFADHRRSENIHIKEDESRYYQLKTMSDVLSSRIHNIERQVFPRNQANVETLPDDHKIDDNHHEHEEKNEDDE